MRFSVSLPEPLRPFIEKLVSGSGINDQTTIAVVVGLFSAHAVTLERAAELANRSMSDFIDLLHSRGIPWMEYGEEEKQQDDRAIQSLLQDLN